MSKELAKTYDPKGIEDRIYQNWLDKKYFHAEVDRSKKPFTIVMPPPNVTGQLHMGHALDNTMQDILIRYKRMQGYNALWQPGTDHAAIATEVKVIQKLKEQGIDKNDIGREEFLKHAWEPPTYQYRPVDRLFPRQPLRHADCITEHTILPGCTPRFHAGRQLHEKELYHRHKENQRTRQFYRKKQHLLPQGNRRDERTVFHRKRGRLHPFLV